MLVEEAEAVGAHSGSCMVGKQPGRLEPEAGLDSEAEQRKAPSGCGRESPEAEALVSGGGRVRGSGWGRRVTGWDAAWSG